MGGCLKTETMAKKSKVIASLLSGLRCLCLILFYVLLFLPFFIIFENPKAKLGFLISLFRCCMERQSFIQSSEMARVTITSNKSFQTQIKYFIVLLSKGF